MEELSIEVIKNKAREKSCFFLIDLLKGDFKVLA